MVSQCLGVAGSFVGMPNASGLVLEQKRDHELG